MGNGTLGFEELPIAGIIVQLDGTVVAVNDVMRALLGPERRLIGVALSELMMEAGDAQRVLEGGSCEVAFITPSGPRTVSGSVRRVQHDQRSELHLYAVDVTERLRAADEARARWDAETRRSTTLRIEGLGIVAGGIAHDFNNLLVGVLAEASAARDDATLTEPVRETLRRIEAAARRMAELTRQMLAYAGRGEIATQHVDPDELLRELRDPLGQVAGPETTLSVALDGGGVAIETDVGLLRQAVINLVANAGDSGATHIGIDTRIVVRNGMPWWQLEVSDDGGGIDATTIGRIFEPFFSTRADRHGLGLSAVHGIVRRFGGDLEVDSSPGKGARFRARLPAIPVTEAIVPRRAPTRAPLERLDGVRVLIADDEPSVRATVRRLLERRGATVVLTGDGLEAEAILREEEFGLIILDVQMPGRTGYDVLAVARTTQPTVPVMLMSGYTTRVRGEGGEEVPDAFLEKPFTAQSFHATIDELMRGRS